MTGTIPEFSKEKNTIEVLRSMDPNERKECLITNNIKIALTVAWKFGYEEDYESVAMMGLIKAADTYDLDRGFDFSTFAVRVITNEILVYIRKCKRHQQTLSFETVIPGTEGKSLTISDTLGYEDEELLSLEQRETNDRLRDIIHSLPDRDCKIISMLYGIGEDRSYRQQEVAERFGISQVQVSRLKKAILKKMKSMLDNYR